MGRPVISTYIAGIPELLTAECSWVISAGSVDALVGAMAEALNASTDKLTTMGRVGKKQVQQLHSAKNEASKLAQLFCREKPQGVKS